MTANPFAALLRDVPVSVNGDGIAMIGYDAALAALSAAVPADLAEAGKVLEGVTPGPWHAGRLAVGVRGATGMDRLLFETLWHDDQGKTDMRFIAWCREGVPALLARIAAQEAQIKGLEAEAAATDDLMAADSGRIAALETALAAERAKVAKLVEALKPFAEYMAYGGDRNAKGEPLPDTEGVGWVYLTVGDFRRARAAITEAGQ